MTRYLVNAGIPGKARASTCISTRRLAMLLAAMLLAACQPGGFPADAGRSDLAAAQVPGALPPDDASGRCWAGHTTPAVIETVTEQDLITPSRLTPDGSVAAPAVFRTVTRQKMIEDRVPVWFPTPCASALTPDFIATLQRALKARGLYALPLTGQMDAATTTAVRRFQAPRGLDSGRLSLAAARELGLVAEDPALM